MPLSPIFKLYHSYVTTVKKRKLLATALTLFSCSSFAVPVVDSKDALSDEVNNEVFYQCGYHVSHDSSNRYLITLKGSGKCMVDSFAADLIATSGIDAHLIFPEKVLCYPIREVADSVQGDQESYRAIYDFIKSEVPLTEPDSENQLSIKTSAQAHGVDEVMWVVREEGQQKCETVLVKESIPWAINGAGLSKINRIAILGYVITGLYPIYDYISGWLPRSPFPNLYGWFQTISIEQVGVMLLIKLTQYEVVKMNKKVSGEPISNMEAPLKTD